jgi:hypothetical protein
LRRYQEDPEGRSLHSHSAWGRLECFNFMSTTSLLAGVAGEYFVAAELSRRGLIASITLRNTRGIDMVVTNASATRTVTIQCKTSRNRAKKWILNQKSEDFFSDGHFYVFVNLPSELERPSYHIVPSKVVGDFVRKNHRDWLSGTSKGGKARKDSKIRNFLDKENQYLERWDLLGL